MQKIKNKIINFLIQFFYSCIEKLNYIQNPNIHNIEPGDVYWCEMPLSIAKLSRISPGHRIRPYVILDVDEKEIQALVCTSQKKYLGYNDFYCIEKDEERIKKTTYVNTARVWKLPLSYIKNYYFTLTNDDLRQIQQKIHTLMKGTVHEDIGYGSVIKDSENNMYIIFDVEYPKFKCYRLYHPDHSYTVNFRKIYNNDQIYYVDFEYMITLSADKQYQKIDQFNAKQLEAIKHEKENMMIYHRKKYEHSMMLQDVVSRFPVGTVFFNTWDNSYFIYLYHKKFIAYGIRETDWSNERCKLKVVRLEYANKVGILDRSEFNDLLKSMYKTFKHIDVMNYLIENYKQPKAEETLFRTEKDS